MDHLFEQASDEYINALNNILPESMEHQHTFTRHFEKQMHRLIVKMNHPIRLAVLRAVACLAVALLLFGSVITINADAREAFFSWIEEQFGTYVHFFSNKETQDLSPSEYTPGWIPNGYHWVSSYNDEDGSCTILYENDSGQFFRFAYFYNSDQMDFYLFFSDQYDTKDVWIHNGPGKLYLPHDESVGIELIWQDEDGTMLELSGKCEETTLIRAAENIRKK